MSDLSEFFFGSAPSIVRLQCVEISHPDFTTTHRLVRNAVGGVSVTHEDATGPHAYTHFPMQIKVNGTSQDLDQHLEVTLGDLGQVLPAELKLILAANSNTTRPTLVYREYRSDDLAAPLKLTPLTLEVPKVVFNKTGAVIQARPRVFNRARVGEYYTDAKFPMLVGFF